MTSLLPSLLYDFKSLGGCFGKSNGIADDVFRKMSALPLGDAVFHGYWYDPHAEVAGGLRTALYTWKGGGRASFLLVVGNTSRKDAATGLKLDWGKAGVAASPLRDLLSGEVKSESEWAATVLPSHYFLLLVPEGPASPETGNRVARRVER